MPCLSVNFFHTTYNLTNPGNLVQVQAQVQSESKVLAPFSLILFTTADHIYVLTAEYAVLNVPEGRVEDTSSGEPVHLSAQSRQLARVYSRDLETNVAALADLAGNGAGVPSLRHGEDGHDGCDAARDDACDSNREALHVRVRLSYQHQQLTRKQDCFGILTVRSYPPGMTYFLKIRCSSITTTRKNATQYPRIERKLLRMAEKCSRPAMAATAEC